MGFFLIFYSTQDLLNSSKFLNLPSTLLNSAKLRFPKHPSHLKSVKHHPHSLKTNFKEYIPLLRIFLSHKILLLSPKNHFFLKIPSKIAKPPQFYSRRSVKSSQGPKTDILFRKFYHQDSPRARPNSRTPSKS